MKKDQTITIVASGMIIFLYFLIIKPLVDKGRYTAITVAHEHVYSNSSLRDDRLYVIDTRTGKVKKL